MMAQFRPICLSNVIIKVIANWLKPLVGNLVGPGKVSFIPGRQTSDNIIVACELLHSLCKKKGRKGSIIVKIDLEKAYDRVN